MSARNISSLTKRKSYWKTEKSAVPVYLEAQSQIYLNQQLKHIKSAIVTSMRKLPNLPNLQAVLERKETMPNDITDALL